jgi:hypothetical protein
MPPSAKAEVTHAKAAMLNILSDFFISTSHFMPMGQCNLLRKK